MNIYILGGGSFGTAMGNQLSINKNNNVKLFVRNEEQLKEINSLNTNRRFFPNKLLNENLLATSNVKDLVKAEILFIALPSKEIIPFFKNIKAYLNKNVLIVNLSKGIFKKGKTITDYLKEEVGFSQVISMKGPTFASELINNSHSIFTLGLEAKSQFLLIEKVIKGTNIHVDYTTDIRGVELLSVIKNIYAIILGVVDAKHNSPNTRFMVLTKAFSELKTILIELGGRGDTLFLSCGFGDLGLTSLNDLSRNRTLGLLIGKGFYAKQKHGVVIEGVKTIDFINDVLSDDVKSGLPLFRKIQSFFEVSDSSFDIHFESLIDKKMKTVLTYGTFDLLHYGHIEILRRAREMGDKLVVGLSTDEFNKIKGKKCEIPYQKRKEFLEAIGYVDLVIPEDNWDQKVSDVLNNNVDLFVMGDDWKGEFDYLKEHCKVTYLPRTIGISTTKLKSVLKRDDK